MVIVFRKLKNAVNDYNEELEIPVAINDSRRDLKEPKQQDSTKSMKDSREAKKESRIKRMKYLNE